jgi:hypothetical protein
MHASRLASTAVAFGVALSSLTFGTALANAAPADPAPPCPTCQFDPGPQTPPGPLPPADPAPEAGDPPVVPPHVGSGGPHGGSPAYEQPAFRTIAA